MEKRTCRKNCELFLSYNFATLFFRQNYRILKKEKAQKTLIFWAF